MIHTSVNIMGQTTYQAACDFCPAIAEPSLRMSLAIVEAAEAGWYIGRKYYCPACQEVRRYDLIDILERA